MTSETASEHASGSTGLDAPILFYNRHTGRIEEEDVYGGRGVRLAYASPIGPLLRLATARTACFSRLCGFWMSRPASRRQVRPFIERFGIDEGELEKRPEEFTSFNDFFIRRLRPGARPIDEDPDSVVFPADGRHLGFASLSKGDGVFVKGQRFELRELLQDDGLAERYRDGAAVLSRLCPVDYHRFHFPVAGTPRRSRPLGGRLDSVNPIALRRRLGVLFENRRLLTTLTTEAFGMVTMVEVGATCVGSIVETYLAEAPADKGAEKGYFQLGGSAIVTLFERDRLRLAPDLLEHSAERRELYAHVGAPLGWRR
jgi:phosphatidylserine decarboxylase